MFNICISFWWLVKQGCADNQKVVGMWTNPSYSLSYWRQSGTVVLFGLELKLFFHECLVVKKLCNALQWIIYWHSFVDQDSDFQRRSQWCSTFFQPTTWGPVLLGSTAQIQDMALRGIPIDQSIVPMSISFIYVKRLYSQSMIVTCITTIHLTVCIYIYIHTPIKHLQYMHKMHMSRYWTTVWVWEVCSSGDAAALGKGAKTNHRLTGKHGYGDSQTIENLSTGNTCTYMYI